MVYAVELRADQFKTFSSLWEAGGISLGEQRRGRASLDSTALPSKRAGLGLGIPVVSLTTSFEGGGRGEGLLWLIYSHSDPDSLAACQLKL